MPDRGLPVSEPIELLPKAAVDAVHENMAAGRQVDPGSPAAAIVLALLVAAFATHNLLYALLFADARGETPAGFLLMAASTGVLLSQAGILAAGLVFGGGPFVVRLLLHWMAAMLLFGSLLIGRLVAHPATFDIRQLALGVLVLPAISLGFQTPLWLLRLYFGWRIEPRSGMPPPRPWSIGDFLVGTLVVAASLAALRLGTIVVPNMAGDELGLAALIAVPGFAAASLIAVVPFMRAILEVRTLESGLVAIVCYTALLCGCLGIVVYQMSHGRVPIADYVFVVAPVAGFALTQVSTGLLVRWCGYRLRVGRAG